MTPPNPGPSASTAPILSVILPIYQGRDWIEGCFASQAAQEAREGVEWIAVDSGADGSGAWIAQHHPWARVIQSAQRLRIGQARNRGVAAARGSWFAFTDQDTRAPKDWTKKILERIAEGEDYFGGAIRNGTADSVVGTADYFLCFNEYFPNARTRRGRNRLAGANLVISRRAWERVGPMEEALDHSEDTVYGRKLYEAGFAGTLFGNLETTHINRVDPDRFLANQRRYGEGAARTRLQFRLHGDLLIGRPWLARALPLYRLAVNVGRILRDRPGYLWPFLRCLPWYLRGLREYARAFSAVIRAEAKRA